MEPSQQPSIEHYASALRDALARALAEPLSRNRTVRAFSARVALDKSLGWKLWRMATAPTPDALLRVLPKSRGMRKIFAALRQQKIQLRMIESVEAAASQLLRALEEAERVGAALPRTEGAVTSPRHIPRAELRKRYRRQHEEDAAAVGQSIELSVGAFFLTPDATNERVDIAACALVDGPRCSHGGLPVVVYASLAAWEGEKHIVAHEEGRRAPASIPGFLPELSSDGIHPSQFSVHAELPGGATEWGFLPRPGTPETLAFLERLPSVGAIWAGEKDDSGLVCLSIRPPTRRAILEVFFHRALPAPALTVSFRKASFVYPAPPSRLEQLPNPFPDGMLLECKKPPLGLGSAQQAARYGRLLSTVVEAVGASMKDFRQYRISIETPPRKSFLIVDWPLPQRRPETQSRLQRHHSQS